MKRLDIALVEWGIAPTRSKAQQMIAAGEIEVLIQGEWRIADRDSQSVADSRQVRQIQGDTLKYVSRGGLKLEGVLADLSLNVQGWRCLDVGLSTGGFADCLLRAGAAQVLGLDVGHGQLHSSLQQESRLTSVEGLHVKDLAANAKVSEFLKAGIQLCVVDLSFISLEVVLPTLAKVLPTGCALLALVKPQFEVGGSQLNKKGVVKDAALYEDVRRRILLSLEKCGFSFQSYLASRVKGQDGNQEFFVFAHQT